MCLLLQVGSLHGELQASERGATLEAARNGAFRLLLVSDLAARGLDLPQVRGCQSQHTTYAAYDLHELHMHMSWCGT